MSLSGFLCSCESTMNTLGYFIYTWTFDAWAIDILTTDFLATNYWTTDTRTLQTSCLIYDCLTDYRMDIGYWAWASRGAFSENLITIQKMRVG